MPATLENPPTEISPPPSIEYARSTAPVTRRQFRLLLFLTFLNTLFLAWFVAGPVISQFTRAQWQGIQNRLQIRKARQQQINVLQQAAVFTEPADQVIYEEDPERAATLSSSSPNYLHVGFDSSDSFRPKPTTRPAYRKLPPMPSQLHAAMTNAPAINERLILLHSLKNSQGESRLIWICLNTIQSVQPNGEPTPDRRRLDLTTRRLLKAFLIQQKQGTGPIPTVDAGKRLTTLELRSPNLLTSFTWTKTTGPEKFRLDVDPHGLFRIYAAQLDPADPSHFTIDYAIDNQRNTIDGYLKPNDKLDLIPRAGQIAPTRDPTNFIWDPFAAPTTRPSPQ
jgi:hypothetical protein